MKRTFVATFNKVDPAKRLQKRLQEDGLDAVIRDETNRERYWFMSEPLAAIHVEVDDSNFVAARDRIAELDKKEHLLKEAVCCPDCGSSRIEYPQVTRKFLMPVLEAALMAMRILPRKFYCRDCHYTWPSKQRTESERDALGFPLESKFWHPERFPKDAGEAKEKPSRSQDKQ